MSIASELRHITAYLAAPGALTPLGWKNLLELLRDISARVAALEADLDRARRTIDGIADDAAEDAAVAELQGRRA